MSAIGRLPIELLRTERRYSQRFAVAGAQAREPSFLRFSQNSAASDAKVFSAPSFARAFSRCFSREGSFPAPAALAPRLDFCGLLPTQFPDSARSRASSPCHRCDTSFATVSRRFAPPTGRALTSRSFCRLLGQPWPCELQRQLAPRFQTFTEKRPPAWGPLELADTCMAPKKAPSFERYGETSRANAGQLHARNL